MARRLKRILVVDDDRDVRDVAVIALRRIGGFEVEATGSGPAAIDLARAFRPDLVLLDVVMPTMDGPAVLRSLRADPNQAETPVVFMTARTQARDLAEYRALGCLDVIVKPFTPSSLPQLVREAWHRKPERIPAASPGEDFDDWRRRYLEELPERVAALRRAAQNAQQTMGDRRSLSALGVLAHRLAGSAAIYGLPSLSTAASDLDDAVEELLARDAASAADVGRLSSLAAAVVRAMPRARGRRRPAKG